METANSSTLRFDLLLASVRGLREWRALTLLLLGGIVWGLLSIGLMVLFRSPAGFVVGAIAGLICWLIAYLGAGRIFMARARGDTAHIPMSAAIGDGLRMLPQGIGAAILIFLAALAVCIAEVIVFLLCKIPYLGPVLYFFLQPAGMVVAAVAAFALWVITLLAMPAVWDGRGALDAFRSSWASLRRDPGEVGFLLLALLVLVWMVSAVISSILLVGALFSMGIGLGIVGGGGFTAGLAMGSPMYALMGAGSYEPGILFGWIVVWVLMTILPLGMLLQGQALIYGSMSERRSAADSQAPPADAVP